ncbi:PIN-like domain-containing protein [Amycolatopsis nigrescens]|uniref:PIN-like domain-containing protein n=1 Tax=Amycolatopsis nigrescens TaxID=381445 RepID=UPI0012FCE2AC|nr:PIN domain-containing protein [Amycolatopsis nigrescens]
MKATFHGYLPLQSDEYDALFSEGIVVLDTNALLNLYRYTPKSRRELLNGLEVISKQLWLPHQVGLEFHRRRIDIIREQQSFYNKIEKIILSSADGIRSQIETLSINPFVDIKSTAARIDKFFRELESGLRNEFEESLKEYGISPRADPVIEELMSLYDGKVGDSFSNEEWDEIRKDADRRYDSEIPPGFRDKHKTDEDAKYGDFVIWKQMLNYASQQARPILFVTDDNKEDWWWKSKGQTLGPHPVLREEFRNHTGKTFYAYRTQVFVEKLKERTEGKVSADTLNEVKLISEKQDRYREERENERLLREESLPIAKEVEERRPVKNESISKTRALYRPRFNTVGDLRKITRSLERERELKAAELDMARRRLSAMANDRKIYLTDSVESIDEDVLAAPLLEFTNAVAEMEQANKDYSRASEQYRAALNEQRSLMEIDKSREGERHFRTLAVEAEELHTLSNRQIADRHRKPE